MSKFKVGDKVRCIEGTLHVSYGAIGEVVFMDAMLLINWISGDENTLQNFVHYNGNTGLWIERSKVELYKEPEKAKEFVDNWGF